MSPSPIALTFAATLATASFILPAHAMPAATQTDSGMRGFLSPQQRAMLMLEDRGTWKTMSADDRHAARDKMRAQWIAMNPTEREAKRAELQAKWDALPQAQKDEFNQRIQQMAARRTQNGAGQ